MRKNGWMLAFCAAAVCCAVGCSEDSTDVCGECGEGYYCNTITKVCTLNPDACNNTCASNERCNEEKHSCEPITVVDACNNSCVAPLICNQVTGQCEDACHNSCVAPMYCDTATATCKNADPGLPCGGICEASGTKCNTATNTCVQCLEANDCTSGMLCSNNQCVQCISSSDCADGQECKSGQCVGSSACGSCQKGQICNDATGKCVMNKKCGVEYQTCENNDDCESIVADYAGARSCIGGYCVWNACIDKTWDPENEGCGNLSGELYTCEEKECEEPEENVVINFSFENWDGGSVTNWQTRNDQGSDVVASKSEDAYCGSYSVNLSNTMVGNGNLDSDPIPVPEKNYTGGNVKLTCSAWVKGEGNLNFGYLGFDANGKKVSDETKPAKKQRTLSGVWEQVEMDVSMGQSKTFKVTIGLGKGEVVVDNVICTQNGTICDNVTCNEWEICSVSSNLKDEEGNYIGKCVAQDGRCNVTDDKPEQGTCMADQICDTTTHTCKRADGKCITNKDCTDDSKPVCDATNNCVAGDPCAKVDCKVDWRECTLASRGSCLVKAGRCLDSADCTKDAPACYGATHTCVAPDFAVKVSKQKECTTVDKEYFNYFNYVDEDPKGQMKYDSLMCPINIIPNGSFEDWIEFRFTEKSDPHTIPDWWYAMDDYNNFTAAAYKYMTELSFDAVKLYQDSTYHGKSAMQLIYTGQGGNNRLTSFGFPVPAGTWDCSYWVRGAGDVKIHTYSNRGDAKATDYVTYNTTEWTRGTFNLKDSASDARIIIYVSNTKADKDHIQLDNFVCTAKGSVVE